MAEGREHERNVSARLFFTGCVEERETLSRKLRNDSVWLRLTAGVATPRPPRLNTCGGRRGPGSNRRKWPLFSSVLSVWRTATRHAARCCANLVDNCAYYWCNPLPSTSDHQERRSGWASIMDGLKTNNFSRLVRHTL